MRSMHMHTQPVPAIGLAGVGLLLLILTGCSGGADADGKSVNDFLI
jgi:hypothetical protein